MDNSGKSRKNIAVPAVLAVIICIALLGVSMEYSAHKLNPGGSPPVKTDESGSTSHSSISSLSEADSPEKDAQDVRTLVEDFGKTLSMVSLTAPKDMAAASIKDYYSKYVTPGLLQKWLADPESAPGRYVSSPWPDRIDILGLEPGAPNQYTVNGEIIEVTSTEQASGGAAAKRPVTIEVQKKNGNWLISGVTLGDYVQRGPIAYENTRYGFSFYLPESWKGYSIAEEQWKGTKDGKTAETGPELLIRHPDWTADNPRQDIPIMVFTREQWDALQKEDFYVSAAPIGPGELGSNSKYVFALPPRYNFAFPTGYEEVEDILKGSPLWPEDPAGSGS